MDHLYPHIMDDKVELKENGIYALPDGCELIARTGMLGNYLLHDPSKGVAAAPLFLIYESGQVLSWGRITGWSTKDLRDTGKVSLPQMERLQMV